MWELKPDKYMTEGEVKTLRKITEEKAIVDLAKGRIVWVRIWMMVDVVTEIGLRVAELTRVKVRDLNIKRDPYIHVLGKGSKARDVFISNGLVGHLKQYIRSFDIQPDAYLLTCNQRQFTTMGLQQQFKRACKVAGLPEHYSIHSARHTFGTLLYAKYKDLRMVQKQLGHSNINTTTVYADVSKSDILNAMNGLFER